VEEAEEEEEAEFLKEAIPPRPAFLYLNLKLSVSTPKQSPAPAHSPARKPPLSTQALPPSARLRGFGVQG